MEKLFPFQHTRYNLPDNIKSAFVISREITSKHIPVSENTNNDQIISTIAPIISNEMFLREQRVLHNERWETIRILAATLSQEDFYNTVKALNYNLWVTF